MDSDRRDQLDLWLGSALWRWRPLHRSWPNRPGMARIPEGPFEMGRAHALPDDGLKWVPHLLRDDRPVRTVTVSAFEIDVHEVTNREYAEFVEASGTIEAPYYWLDGKPPPGRSDEPVANVHLEGSGCLLPLARKTIADGSGVGKGLPGWTAVAEVSVGR